MSWLMMTLTWMVRVSSNISAIMSKALLMLCQPVHMRCALFWRAWIAGDGMPDMGLYYYKSEEAQKNGEKPSGRVELLGVKITTETEPKTNETIMILDSDFRTIKCVAFICCLPAGRVPVRMPSYLLAPGSFSQMHCNFRCSCACVPALHSQLVDRIWAGSRMTPRMMRTSISRIGFLI